MGKGIRIWSQGIVTGSGTISDLLLGIVQVVFTDPHYGEVVHHGVINHFSLCLKDQRLFLE